MLYFICIYTFSVLMADSTGMSSYNRRLMT
jgi:hypothetical protein